jgi:hypothetical protein
VRQPAQRLDRTWPAALDAAHAFAIAQQESHGGRPAGA